LARDKYGFKIDPTLVEAFRVYINTYYAGRLAQQKDSWRRFFSRTDLDKSLETRDGLAQLKVLVRQGIPAELRGEVRRSVVVATPGADHVLQLWQLISSSKRRKTTMPGYYASLQREPDLHDPIVSQIDRVRCREPRPPPLHARSAHCILASQDLDRTFPNHLIYELGEGQRRLRRVLLAYAQHNPHIGYCQSMNCTFGVGVCSTNWTDSVLVICALLLLFMDEESAFWLLVAIAEDMIPEYYTPHMLGIRSDTAILDVRAPFSCVPLWGA
jgi:hypothetical protein